MRANVGTKGVRHGEACLHGLDASEGNDPFCTLTLLLLPGYLPSPKQVYHVKCVTEDSKGVRMNVCHHHSLHVENLSYIIKFGQDCVWNTEYIF